MVVPSAASRPPDQRDQRLLRVGGVLRVADLPLRDAEVARPLAERAVFIEPILESIGCSLELSTSCQDTTLGSWRGTSAVQLDLAPEA